MVYIRCYDSVFVLSLKKNTKTYFYTGFLAYIFGLGLTIFIMHTFKHAQVRVCMQSSVGVGESARACVRLHAWVHRVQTI